MVLKLLMFAVSLYLFLQCYFIFFKMKGMNHCQPADQALIRSHRLFLRKYEIDNMPKTDLQLRLLDEWKLECKEHIDSLDYKEDKAISTVGLTVVQNE